MSCAPPDKSPAIDNVLQLAEELQVSLSLPFTAEGIELLWDQLDDPSKVVLRELIELKVNALQRPVDPGSIQVQFDKLDRSAQDRVRHMINLELGAMNADRR